MTFRRLAAFVFARRAFPGREVLFTFFTLGLLFPSAVAILPLFVLVRTLGLLDNPLGHRAAGGGVRPAADDHHPAAVLPEHPDRARGRGRPSTAAARSGSSGGSCCRLSRPALATVTILAIVYSWNQFLLPLVMLSDEANWTLPLGVTNFSTQYTTDTARVLAYTTLSLDPGARLLRRSPSASWWAA